MVIAAQQEPSYAEIAVFILLAIAVIGRGQMVRSRTIPAFAVPTSPAHGFTRDWMNPTRENACGSNLPPIIQRKYPCPMISVFIGLMHANTLDIHAKST